MVLKKRRKGIIVTIDEYANVVKVEDDYVTRLEDCNCVRLLKSEKFYLSLVIPILLSFLIYLLHTKPFIVFFSVALGVSLIPLLKTIDEIFEIRENLNLGKDGNKNMA